MTGDDDTITLKDAAKLFGFSVSTLRTEADRGRLTIYRIGNRYYTTPADIREMVNQCRVVPKVPAADSVMSDAERTSAAMAAVKEAMLGLRKR
jgi:Helix-turn-helix domain